MLLDIGLPGMDGYEVAAPHPRASARSTDALLVALTGWGQDERPPARPREAASTSHLVKPVDLGDLRALLDACDL